MATMFPDPGATATPNGPAGGDLGGTYPNPTVTDLTMAGEAAGDILVRGASAWSVLHAGAAGTVPSPVGGTPAWVTPASLSTTQTVSSDTTMTANADHVHVTATSSITLPAVSSFTIGHPTLITARATSSLTVTLVPNAADKIEGAAQLALIGRDIVCILTPVAANRWVVAPIRGLAQWLHCAVDFTTATGSSPWTVSGVTVTDISTASSSFAAAAGGLTATAKSGSGYTGGGTADCAVAKIPLASLLDGWSRPLSSDTDSFWFLADHERTTSSPGTVPSSFASIGGSTNTSTPRVAVYNSSVSAVTGYTQYASSTASVNTSVAPSTARSWLGMLWNGPERSAEAMVFTSAATGNPGVSGGWWPLTYAHAQRLRITQAYVGQAWDISTLTDLHIAQVNTTTGQKWTWYSLYVLMQRGTPS